MWDSEKIWPDEEKITNGKGLSKYKMKKHGYFTT
jgi:hypothetical protein